MVFTCCPLSYFCFPSCFHAFLVTVSVAFPPSFLCINPSFSFPILFFLLLHLHFCEASAFPPVIFVPPASCSLHHPFSLFIRPFVFLSGFAFWNEAKTKAKTKAKFSTRSLAWTWPGAGKYFDNYHCFCCRHLSNQQQSTSKAPTAPPSRDCC